MAQFMVMLFQTPGWTDSFDPVKMQDAVEKYMAWTKKPFTLDAKRLAPGPGKRMRTEGGQVRAVDGPYAETKEVMGGFYLIEAADYDEAIERAMDHPHLEYGGTLEIKQLYGT